MKRNVTSRSPAVCANGREKNNVEPSSSRRDLSSVGWSTALSASGAFLVIGSFLVEAINCGEVAALGGAVSSAALFRAFGEKNDGAGFVAGLSLFTTVIFLLFRLCAYSK